MTPKTEPSVSGLDDPRQRPDFTPRHYPKADGRDAPPPGSAAQNDQLTLKFLAAYYDLNCAYSRLLDVRRAPPSPQRTEAERKCLQSVESLLTVRDRLEDQYAPFGLIADPVIEDGFTVNVKFSFGNVDAFGRHRSDAYTITACVPVPLPEGVRLEQLPIRVEGPGIKPE